MGNTEEHPHAPGAPETEGASDVDEVVDLPEGATPSTPGYEATRQQVDAAERASDDDSDAPDTDG